MKEFFESLSLTAILWFFGVLLVIGAGVVWMYFAPYFENKQTEINQHTLQAYRTEVTEMKSYVNEYSKLELQKSQPGADVKSINARQVVLSGMFCNAYDLVASDVQPKLPENILQFERAHPCQ